MVGSQVIVVEGKEGREEGYGWMEGWGWKNEGYSGIRKMVVVVVVVRGGGQGGG